MSGSLFIETQRIPWAIKSAALSWTITPMFLGGLLHFLYQQKEE